MEKRGCYVINAFVAKFKGTNNSLCIKFLAFVIFPVFVKDRMCQYFKQQVNRKEHYEVDKNIHRPEPILSCKQEGHVSLHWLIHEIPSY